MNILVLNGSPKGEYSITLQTVRYLEKLHPEHFFDVLHVGRLIKQMEKDFSKAAHAIQKADLLLFSYPVYTFIAPYQLHRFIELRLLTWTCPANGPPRSPPPSISTMSLPTAISRITARIWA